MEWFVHVDQRYYPYCGVVEADTADWAVALVRGKRCVPEHVGIAVVPLSAVTMVGGDPAIQEMVDRLDVDR